MVPVVEPFENTKSGQTFFDQNQYRYHRGDDCIVPGARVYSGIGQYFFIGAPNLDTEAFSQNLSALLSRLPKFAAAVAGRPDQR